MPIPEYDKKAADDIDGLSPQADAEMDAHDDAEDAPLPSEVAMRINLLGKLIIPRSAP